ncbi:PREDICTED: uncharacterized protein LOC108366318 [Rhagoletis zephyria]|uniref:uncharacterized protein LOC108366318 n=1 Tax=Rhagoletis zephyria TaxID=28612 RepID=UPI0008117909|nr:PREDICTED: uncharacterized protein LOC108366318 [Rhagoletis zephyria]XP_017476161.1 PREDICTED: uncharacterized protein LOC108366318 [Rhagoletis zephyria]
MEQNVGMDQDLFEDQDFSADDDVVDPNFIPEKVIRKRNIVADSDSAVSTKRMRSVGRSSPKLIFNSEFYVAMEKSNGRTTAKCAACNKIIRGTEEVTSNFISHLKVRHNDLHKKYLSMKSGPSRETTTQEAFEQKIIRFLVDCALPVSIVEKDLFSGTGWHVMCKKSAMKKLDESKHGVCSTE